MKDSLERMLSELFLSYDRLTSKMSEHLALNQDLTELIKSREFLEDTIASLIATYQEVTYKEEVANDIQEK